MTTVPWGNADRLPIPEYLEIASDWFYQVIGAADWVGPYATLEAARAAFIAEVGRPRACIICEGGER